jgi:hypothetical protein
MSHNTFSRTGKKNSHFYIRAYSSPLEDCMLSVSSYRPLFSARGVECYREPKKLSKPFKVNEYCAPASTTRHVIERSLIECLLITLYLPYFSSITRPRSFAIACNSAKVCVPGISNLHISCKFHRANVDVCAPTVGDLWQVRPGAERSRMVVKVV